MVLDDGNKVQVFRYEFPKQLTRLGEFQLEPTSFIFDFVLIDRRLYYVTKESQKVRVNVVLFSADFAKIEKQAESEVGAEDFRIEWAGSLQDQFVVVSKDNYFFRASEEDGSLQQEEKLPFIDDSVESVRAFALPNNAASRVVLTKRNRLFIDHLKIAEDVSSCLVLPRHICFTTVQQTPYDLLFTLPSLSFSKLSIPLNTPSHSENWISRNIEKGGTLLAYSNSKVILQMPRGNFESFHPRILIVEEVLSLIHAGKFAECLNLLKRHRLPMSLILDLDPQATLTAIPTLVKAIPIDLLDLFIMDLSDDFATELQSIMESDKFLSLKA